MIILTFFFIQYLICNLIGKAFHKKKFIRERNKKYLIRKIFYFNVPNVLLKENYVGTG